MSAQPVATETYHLATQWYDIDFGKKTLNVRKSIWHQHVGPVKTNESEKAMPLDDEMIADLLRWRSLTPYAGDRDWIFASERMKGRQPLWPEAIERNYIRPAAKRAKIYQAHQLACVSAHILDTSR